MNIKGLEVSTLTGVNCQLNHVSQHHRENGAGNGDRLQHSYLSYACKYSSALQIPLALAWSWRWSDRSTTFVKVSQVLARNYIGFHGTTRMGPLKKSITSPFCQEWRKEYSVVDQPSLAPHEVLALTDLS